MTYLALIEDLPDVRVVVLPGGVDVVPDGSGEQGRVLRDHRQVRPEGVQAHALSLDAVEPDGAGARVDEVEEGDSDRTLARAGPAAYPDLKQKTSYH